MSLDYRKIFSLKFLSIVLLLLISVSAMAFYQDTRPYELEDSNNQLNKTYQTILSKLPASEQEKLRRAQREWIIFRDLDCAWAFGVKLLECLIDRTDNRNKELRNTDFRDVNGKYYSIEIDGEK